MNISILVFGSDRFFDTLPDQIRNATAFNVEVLTNLNQVISRIQISPPDIIFVQASLDGSIELCCWLKDQIKLSWIYCILLEDRPELLTSKSIDSIDWEVEIHSAVLRQGADAYIWCIEDGLLHTGSVKGWHRLLLAQLTVGLRKVQKYRDLIRTNDLLSAIALADSLTELNNRRALEWDLPRQIEKARNHGSTLSLIILDVDYFKKVNDTYGHLVGDRLLQLLCTRMRHNLRFQDTPFRYGGEEFVILLSNTTCNEAFIVARRLNRIVSEEPFAINNKLAINITISLGTACLEPEDDSQGISLLNRADQYLLQAKASGRNRVIGCHQLSPHIVPTKIRTEERLGVMG
ncbi:diguanylate cyclase [Aetokthonos hydrillicola Thurmond2011]|jgi:two-component system cell cycle response regulator|uniref:Diguanylate cyclase n=2 Tax=Aetokthonos TaxID=1550243 RepID=A0AAP5IBK1_9CYAN|nr:diguanylate cyclase [Aetokthonos hydrillicola]MBO3462465.1 diguanylate cyclase [Aetokthonos hydrillicola CCALA 1050]MBW4589841.1 diguanylate cyclase [Aetokthonos hydrillicola CCALA 1050]MDR9898411.1 diguanylate cyclase [Aetokthonos hydrillicola Thurmond2011]